MVGRTVSMTIAMDVVDKRLNQARCGCMFFMTMVGLGLPFRGSCLLMVQPVSHLR